MPPKGSSKSKTEDKPPATPEKSKSKPKTDGTPSKDVLRTPAKTPAKTPVETPKKTPGTTINFTSLDKPSSGPPIPIDVKRDGINAQSEIVKGKTGSYGKLLKLDASNMFTVGRTVLLTEGEHQGCQAILLHPAKPFEFMKLNPEVRGRIYSFYFASKSIVGGPIVLDGKRVSNKAGYAKTFADGSKNRVALLATCKEVHKDASQIFTALPLRFDNTTTVIDFFTQEPSSLRQRVTNIEIKNYQKTSARNALHLLAEANNLQSLHFDSAAFAGGDPMKAAITFYSDGYKFLQSMAETKGDKDTAVDILSFAKGAFTLKDDSKKDKGTVKNWPDTMVEEFRQCLKGKVTSSQPLHEDTTSQYTYFTNTGIKTSELGLVSAAL